MQGFLGLAEDNTYALGVKSADNELLKLTLLIVLVALLIALLLGLGLGLALLSVGLDVLHLLIGLLLGSLHQLLDGSGALRLLGLGGVAGAAVGLLIGLLVRLLVVATAEKLLEVLVLVLIIALVVVDDSDDLQGRAVDGGDVALLISLGGGGRVKSSHGDANLELRISNGLAVGIAETYGRRELDLGWDKLSGRDILAIDGDRKKRHVG